MITVDFIKVHATEISSTKLRIRTFDLWTSNFWLKSFIKIHELCRLKHMSLACSLSNQSWIMMWSHQLHFDAVSVSVYYGILIPLRPHWHPHKNKKKKRKIWHMLAIHNNIIQIVKGTNFCEWCNIDKPFLKIIAA